MEKRKGGQLPSQIVVVADESHESVLLLGSVEWRISVRYDSRISEKLHVRCVMSGSERRNFEKDGRVEGR